MRMGFGKFLFGLSLLCGICLHSEAAEKVRVACVVDSITYGAGIREAEATYPRRLAELLGEGYEVRNFGSNGTTMLRDSTKPYCEQAVYGESLKFKPDIVVIKLGTNDSKPQNIANAKKLREDAKKLINSYKQPGTETKIYICRPIPVETDMWGISEDGISNTVWPEIERAAKDLDIPVIDLHSALVGESAEYADGVHPNPYGAYKIAAKVYETITGKPAPKRPKPLEFSLDDGSGHKLYRFMFGGREVKVLAPNLPLEGNLWIWRPAFFGAFDNADRALLKKGFYIVYCDFTNEYGNPKAVADGKRFFDMMTARYKLSSKVALEGLSRGGLYVINYAKTYPETVSCVYIDAPVCNLASWPGEKSSLWPRALEKWGVKAIGKDFQGNAYFGLENMAKEKIPVLMVCGGADKVVPFKDNGEIFEQAYKKLGGEIRTIIKPEVGHHPHGLDDPAPIVDFVVKNAAGNAPGTN